MKEFLWRYSSLFLMLPLWIIAGILFAPGAYALVFISFIFWYKRRQYHILFIAALLILTLGDSLHVYLSVFKDLRIMVILILALLSFQLLKVYQKGLAGNFVIVLPFFILAYACLANSPIPMSGFLKTTSYLILLFVIFHLLPFLADKTNYRIFLDAGYLIVLVLLVCIPYSVLFDPSFLATGMYGIFGNPNGLGIYCTLGIIYLTFLRLLFPKKRWFLLFAAGLVVVCTLLSQSRTALLAVSLFLVGHFIHANRSGLYILIFWGGLVIVVFTLRLPNLIGIITSLGLSDLLNVETLSIGGGRFIAWQYALPQLKENFWFGDGFGYTQHFFKQAYYILRQENHVGNMHNSYLTLLMNVGIFGLVLFLIFLTRCFLSIPRSARYLLPPVLLACLISTNFESWLSASLNSYTIYFYTFILMLLCLPRPEVRNTIA